MIDGRPLFESNVIDRGCIAMLGSKTDAQVICQFSPWHVRSNPRCITKQLPDEVHRLGSVLAGKMGSNALCQHACVTGAPPRDRNDC